MRDQKLTDTVEDDRSKNNLFRSFASSCFLPLGEICEEKQDEAARHRLPRSEFFLKQDGLTYQYNHYNDWRVPCKRAGQVMIDLPQAILRSSRSKPMHPRDSIRKQERTKRSFPPGGITRGAEKEECSKSSNTGPNCNYSRANDICNRVNTVVIRDTSLPEIVHTADT